MLRSRLLGALALVSSLAVASVPAIAATLHSKRHAHVSHIHRPQVMDTVARRETPILHHSAALMTHDTLSNGRQVNNPA